MAQEVNWSYLRNPFDNRTKGNFKRMMLMARDHHDKLLKASTTQPDIATMYAIFEPAYTAFNTALRSKHISDSMRQTKTMQIVEAFELLRTKVEEWDIRISFLYRPTTPEYKLLMGGGRTSFYMGSYEGQLATVSELSQKLAAFTNLADVKTDVDAWFADTDALRTAQQGEEGSLQRWQKEVERARVTLANKMHFILGSLIAKYHEDPIEVENFYELKYLQRSTSKKTATTAPNSGSTGAKIPANGRKTLLKGSFSENDAFEIKNTGNVRLQVWLSGNEKSAIPADVSTIVPATTLTFYGDEITDGSATLQFLIISNNEGTEGSLEATKLLL